MINKDYLKSGINILVANKTIFSNIFIVTTGSTIGLLLKAVDVGTNLFELMLILIGFILSIIVLVIILNISAKAGELLSQLKGVDNNE